MDGASASGMSLRERQQDCEANLLLIAKKVQERGGVLAGLSDRQGRPRVSREGR